MNRTKQTKIVVYVSNYMSTFEQAQPGLITSFSRNRVDKVEIVYKHSPEDTENVGMFIESIRSALHPHAIVFDQLYWQKKTSTFFETQKLKDIQGLYVEYSGSLSRIMEDGLLVVIPASSIDSIVNH